jgi:ABC-type sugar transport system substrate-binding protein
VSPRRTLLVAALVAAVAVPAALAGAPASSTVTIDIVPALKTQKTQMITIARPRKGLHIGFAHPILSEPGAGTVSAGAAKVAKLAGVAYTVEDAALDVNKQVQIADSMLSRGFDAILTIDLFAHTMDRFYARADAKKVPTVTEYSTRPNSVGEDWRQPGREAAALIRKQFPGGATGVMLSDTPAPVIKDREKGFRLAVAASGGKIKVLTLKRNLKETLDEARRLAEEILQSYPDIDFVWGSNDTQAIGMGLAAKAAGKTLLITGMNGSPEGVKAIKDGLIAVTWDANQNAQGQLMAINALNTIATGKKVKARLLPFTRIDASNASQYIPWAVRAKVK